MCPGARRAAPHKEGQDERQLKACWRLQVPEMNSWDAGGGGCYGGRWGQSAELSRREGPERCCARELVHSLGSNKSCGLGGGGWAPRDRQQSEVGSSRGAGLEGQGLQGRHGHNCGHPRSSNPPPVHRFRVKTSSFHLAAAAGEQQMEQEPGSQGRFFSGLSPNWLPSSSTTCPASPGLPSR